jgi:hypothetical protein
MRPRVYEIKIQEKLYKADRSIIGDIKTNLVINLSNKLFITNVNVVGDNNTIFIKN